MKLRNILIALCFASATAAVAEACGGSAGTNDGGLMDGTTTTCTAPLVQCGGTCSDPKSDPNNCGGCGTVCSASMAQVCSQGACALACGGGTTMCGMSCFDTMTDPNNCGSCGNKCGTGQTCAGSMCVSSCPGSQTLCTGDAGPECVNTATDSANCGSCGNACSPNQTCQGSACIANLVNVGPVNVSGTMTCSTVSGGAGRKTAIDSSNNLYVAMICANTLYVATSTNGGLSYGTPVSTTLTGTEGAIIISSGTTPTLYAATTNVAGALFLSSSADRGKTWAAPQTLDTPIDGSYNYGLSMAMYNTTLYVAVSLGEGSATLHVLRDGIGAGDAGLADVDDAGFSLSSANLVAINPSDIVVDQSTGNVWAIAEADGVYHLAVSTNGGLTFGTAANPPGGAGFTDWTIANGTIFGVGDTDLLYAITTGDPGAQTTMPGLGATNGNDGLRSIGIDSAGNVYVATATNGGMTVARILYSIASSDAGAPDGGAISSLRTIPEIGGGPSITSGPLNAALLAYTVQGGVYATTLAY